MATVAVVQIGSMLARFASGAQRSTLVLRCAMAGAARALASVAAEALSSDLRCMCDSPVRLLDGPPDARCSTGEDGATWYLPQQGDGRRRPAGHHQNVLS